MAAGPNFSDCQRNLEEMSRAPQAELEHHWYLDPTERDTDKHIHTCKYNQVHKFLDSDKILPVLPLYTTTFDFKSNN